MFERKRLSCRPLAESKLQTDNNIISRAWPVNCSRWLAPEPHTVDRLVIRDDLAFTDEDDYRFGIGQ